MLIFCGFVASHAPQTKMSVQHNDLSSALQRYHLSEGDVLQQVSNVHLQEISRSYCLKWRFLPAALMENPKAVVNDIERGGKPEDEQRADFFSRWQSEKGSEANYMNLINALLVIGCRQDAEYVCGLLKKTPGESGGE